MREPRLRDAVDFYAEHGWCVVRGLLDPLQVKAAAAVAGEFLAGPEGQGVPAGVPERVVRHESRARSLRFSKYIGQRNAKLRGLAQHVGVARCAAMLMHTTSVRLFTSSLIAKSHVEGDPNDCVGWHTDRAYWWTCTSENMLTAWIALQDTDGVNGGLLYMDGSHLWEASPDLDSIRFGLNFGRQDLRAAPDEICRIGYQARIAAPRVKIGDVLFHHCLTLHASGSNSSSQSRVALTLDFQDEGNRYQRVWRCGARCTHYIDLVVRRSPNGDPDYSDDEYCPVLWKQAI